MSDFLPCPSCGSAENLRLIRHIAAWRSGVICQCGMNATSVERWNTRALPAVQPVMVRLVFSNADATPKTTVLDVSAKAVPDIMAWYGAYCAGDRYTVTVDGRNVPMDQNGEPAHVNKTPKSEHVPGDMLTPATKGGAHD